MASQSANILSSLFMNRLTKSLPGGLAATGKHKVLPDQNVEFVARIVEGILFVDAPAPDPTIPLAMAGKR